MPILMNKMTKFLPKLILLTGFSIVAAVISGCVTTTVGEPETEADLKEAAGLNLQLGISYYQQRNMTAAREKLEKALEQQPDLPEAHQMLGRVYQAMGEMDEAEPAYRKSVDLAPRDPGIINDYAAFLCFERGEVNRALKYFDQAIRIPLNENRNILYFNAARCAADTDPERAETYLRTAMAADPNNPAIMLQLGALAYKQGQYLQARVFLERTMALMEEPSPMTLFLLSSSEAELGNTRAAQEYASQLIEKYPTSPEALKLQESGLR